MTKELKDALTRLLDSLNIDQIDEPEGGSQTVWLTGNCDRADLDLLAQAARGDAFVQDSDLKAWGV